MSDKTIILHAEDDPNDVMLVGLAFRKAGISAALRVVSDGEQVIEYLSGQGPYSDRHAHPLPALLLLDLKLPRRSGLEVLTWIRNRDELRRLPVVMLTSSGQATDVNRAYDIGVNSFVVKPSVLDELITMARQIAGYWLDLNTKPALTPPE